MNYYSATIGSAYGKIVTGNKSVTSAGTAEQVTTTSTPIGGVWVAADLGEGPVVVGDSSVDATSGSMQGIVLTPGNQSTFIPINNLNLLWVDAQTNGHGLVYSYLQPLSGPTG